MMAPSWSDSQEPESASETQHQRGVPINSTTLMKKIGNLARSRVMTSPHEPVWVEGIDLPVQDVIRHTRSMTSKLEDRGGATASTIITTPTFNRCGSLTVSILLDRVRLNHQKRLFPSIKNISLTHSFFYLPDKEFQTLKLLKLREVSPRAKANRKTVAKNQLILKSNNHSATHEARDVLQENYKSPDKKLMIDSHKINNHIKHGFESTVHASRLGTAGRSGIDTGSPDTEHTSILHSDCFLTADNWTRKANSSPGINVMPHSGAVQLPSYALSCMGYIPYKDDLRDDPASDFLKKHRMWRTVRSERNDILLVMIERRCMSLYRIGLSDPKWDVGHVKSMQMKEAVGSFECLRVTSSNEDGGEEVLILCMGKSGSYFCWVFGDWSAEPYCIPLPLPHQQKSRKLTRFSPYTMWSHAGRVVVAMAVDKGIYCVKLHKTCNRWSIFETSVLPVHLTDGPPVHSLCPTFDLSKTLGAAGGGSMLVGVAGGDMLVWNVESSVLLRVVSLQCSPMPPDTPLLPIVSQALAYQSTLLTLVRATSLPPHLSSPAKPFLWLLATPMSNAPAVHAPTDTPTKAHEKMAIRCGSIEGYTSEEGGPRTRCIHGYDNMLEGEEVQGAPFGHCDDLEDSGCARLVKAYTLPVDVPCNLSVCYQVSDQARGQDRDCLPVGVSTDESDLFVWQYDSPKHCLKYAINGSFLKLSWFGKDVLFVETDTGIRWFGRPNSCATYS